jgi:probable phosphoglycerate mutase
VDLTRFYLVRHGDNDLIGKVIAGWLPGVHLNSQGRAEAEQLAEYLALERLDLLYSSPLERAQETAAACGKRLGLPVQTAPQIGELDFGDWTGQTLDELAKDPRWRQWNECRSISSTPGGETMLDLQGRFVGFIQQLREEQRGKKIALFSHGDPIRSALLYYIGLPIDFFDRIEISPASITLLELSPRGPRFLCVNQTLPANLPTF